MVGWVERLIAFFFLTSNVLVSPRLCRHMDSWVDGWVGWLAGW